MEIILLLALVAPTKTEIHVNFDPYDPVDPYWKQKLEQEWDQPWSKRFQGTRLEGATELAKRLDARVAGLKDKVEIVVYEIPNKPMAYAIGSKFAGWHKLPRDAIPAHTFWLEFIEYLWVKHNIEELTRHHEYEYRRAEHARTQRIRWDMTLKAIKWVKAREGANVNWVNINHDFFHYTQYYPDKVPQQRTIVMDYDYPPAVAQRCPPQVPEDPRKYLLMRK